MKGDQMNVMGKKKKTTKENKKEKRKADNVSA